jgi:hypothetical protein
MPLVTILSAYAILANGTAIESSQVVRADVGELDTASGVNGLKHQSHRPSSVQRG